MKDLFKRREIYLLLVSNVMASIGIGVAMIAVPWFLVNEEGGSKVYGILAFLCNMVLFLVAPFLGVFIDRISRKRMLLVLRGITIVGLVLLYYLATLEFSQIWILISYFGVGSFFYALNIPTRNAFVQEIFPKNHYHWVNSVLEIETQAAAMASGGAAAILLEYVGLSQILLVNLGGMVVSTLAIMGIAYSPKFLKGKLVSTMIEDFRQGCGYLLDRPMYSLFLLASFVPQVCVIVGNYLVPVFLVDVLQARALALATYEIVFGIGAVLSGVLVPYMIARWDYLTSIFVCMGAFTFAILMQAVFPALATIIWTSLLLGYTNGAIRIARNSLMMKLTETHMAGRIMSVIPSIMLGGRAVFTGVATIIVVYAGVIYALWFLVLVLTVAFGLAFLSANRIEVNKLQWV